MSKEEFTPIYRILKERPYFYKWRKEAVKNLTLYRKQELYKATTVSSFFVDAIDMSPTLSYIKDIEKIWLLMLKYALICRNNSSSETIRLKASLNFEINWSRKHKLYDTDEWEEIFKDCPKLT